MANPCNDLDDINDLVHNELYSMNLTNSNMDHYIPDNGNIIDNINDLIREMEHDSDLENNESGSDLDSTHSSQGIDR